MKTMTKSEFNIRVSSFVISDCRSLPMSRSPSPTASRPVPVSRDPGGVESWANFVVTLNPNPPPILVTPVARYPDMRSAGRHANHFRAWRWWRLSNDHLTCCGGSDHWFIAMTHAAAQYEASQCNQSQEPKYFPFHATFLIPFLRTFARVSQV